MKLHVENERMGKGWSEERLLSVIGQIYESAADPARLSVLADLVQEALDIGSALVFISNHKTGDLVHLMGTSANFDPKARADYRAHYHNQNPWYQAAKNKTGLYVKHGGELIGQSDFEKTEFRADWCKRVGIYHFLGGTAPVRDQLAVAVGMHKPFGSAGFSDEDKRVFGILLEHIVRACQLADKIGTFSGREAQTYELLSRLNVGFLLLDEACRPIHVNSIAEGLLRSSRWLTYSLGRVRPVHPGSQPAFEARVAEAALTGSGQGLQTGAVLALRDPIEAPLAVSVIAFASEVMGIGRERPAAAVVFSDPDRKVRASADEIARLFGFTPAESRLVARLIGGDTLVVAARQLGISPNTAKTQMQAIFLKTGCNKQSEVVALVVSNPVARLVQQG